MNQPQPIICTLTQEQREQRGTNWRDALAPLVTNLQERPNGYALALEGGDLELSRIEALAEAEHACCPWMHLELRRGPSPELSITTVSEEGKARIKSMLGL